MCFVVYIKADEIYKDIAEDVETKFDTSNYELEYWIMNYEYFFPKEKKKKNWIMKDKLNTLNLNVKGIMFLWKELIRLV